MNDNGTSMRCPHCNNVVVLKVTYKRHIGSAFKDGFVGPDGAEYEREAKVECENCKRPFLYKLRTVVVCDTAPYPFEEKESGT